jgi:cellulose synthase/poly-beta-1,6-N-acetylglucosamine synthase-like glycosyltransferase
VRLALEIVLLVLGACLVIPALILLIEALAALLPRLRLPEPLPDNRPRLAVLIPAHNEAAMIGATVSELVRHLGPTARIVVIADNCSDDTAARARAAGAKAIERQDPQRRGKGFAISFGLAYLDGALDGAAPDIALPEIVILMDADCRVAAGSLWALAARAQVAQRAIQAEYLLGAPPSPGPMAVVSALAVLLRNRVRPRGMQRLGLPCHLTGSGMAFPWRILRDAPEMESNLVEDLVMGLEMAMRGQPPLLDADVQIASELPVDRGAGMSQRRRWEHGQLGTLRRYVPRLLAAGLRRREPALIGLGLDLLVPPLALLVMLLLGVLGLSTLAALVDAASWQPAVLAAAGLGAVTAAVGLAWWRFGRATLPLRYLLFVPLYLMWKLPLYVGLLVRGRQRTWERTARRQE